LRLIEHVRRLDIPVHDPRRMDLRAGMRELERDPQGARHCEPTLAHHVGEASRAVAMLDEHRAVAAIEQPERHDDPIADYLLQYEILVREIATSVPYELGHDGYPVGFPQPAI